MVQQTNIHGANLAARDSARLKKKKEFKQTDVSELKKLHGLLIAMAICKFRNIASYWKDGKYGAIKYPNFRQFMAK